MDLTRYFQQLSNYSVLSWSSFVELVLKRNILVVQELLFYIIAKTNNFHLLPAIVIFVVYYITLYMITDYAKRNSINSKMMMKVIVFTIFVLPFPSLVSNVRNVLAFSIFILGIYREFQQNKKNLITYLLYILPVFIHISTLALLILRILLKVYSIKKSRRYIISFTIIGSTYLIGTMDSLIDILPFSNRILSSFIKKANFYVSNTSTDYAIYLQSSLLPKLQKIYFVGVVIFLFILLYLINKSIGLNKDSSDKLSNGDAKILSFYSLICLTVIGTSPIVLTVYFRFTIPVIMLSFLLLFRKDMFILNKASRQIINFCLMNIAAVGIIYQTLFLDKLTNIQLMLSSVMVRSLINMFIKV